MRKRFYRCFYWSIPGWFPLVDYELMEIVGDFQESVSIKGHILELGCYKGKSSILLGKLLGQSEELILVDLFEEIGASSVMDTPLYKGLTQKTLERNLKLFQVEATILKIDSGNIAESTETRAFRLIHIDAGHTYEPASKDLDSALHIMQEAGVIILDDYRNISFPGMWVAFAEFVSNREVSVLLATETKAYLVKTEHLNTYKPLLDSIKLSRQFRVLSSTGDPFVTLEFKFIRRFIQKLYSAAGLVSIRLSNLLNKIRLKE